MKSKGYWNKKFDVYNPTNQKLYGNISFWKLFIIYESLFIFQLYFSFIIFKFNLIIDFSESLENIIFITGW